MSDRVREPAIRDRNMWPEKERTAPGGVTPSVAKVTNDPAK